MRGGISWRKAGQHLLDVAHIGGLGDVLVEPRLERLSFVLGLTESADSDEDHVSAELGSNARGYLVAVQAGQADIDERQVRLLLHDAADTFGAVAGGIDVVA